MELPQELGDEIRNKLEKKMKSNGSMKKITERVKDGVKKAKMQIKQNNFDEKLFISPLEGKDSNEYIAIQRILKYLASSGYEWTLAAIQDEIGLPLEKLNQEQPKPSKHKNNETKPKQKIKDNSIKIEKSDFEVNNYIVSVNDL